MLASSRQGGVIRGQTRVGAFIKDQMVTSKYPSECILEPDTSIMSF